MNTTEQLKNFLDQHQTKYITINFSSTYSESEMRLLDDLKHIKIVKVALVQVSGLLKLIVYPEKKTISLDKIKAVHGNSSVEVIPYNQLNNYIPGYDQCHLLPFGFLYNIEMLIDQSLIRAKQIAFFSANKNELIILNYTDYASIIKPNYQNITTKNLVAVKSFVAPKCKRNKLNKYKKCFLGVSLQNENFSDEKRLSATLSWISNHFEQCEVLVGDYIHRLTLQIIDPSLHESEAYEKAIQLGREFISEKVRLINQYANDCQFTIKYMSEYYKEDSYALYRRQFSNFTNRNEYYYLALTTFASTFVQRLIDTKSITNLDKERGITLSRDYLLDEGAIFSQAVSNGSHILVYPGSIDPFIQISEGNYPDAPALLKEMICVGLSLKHIK